MQIPFSESRFKERLTGKSRTKYRLKTYPGEQKGEGFWLSGRYLPGNIRPIRD
ncbi:unnamed protein product [Penicillium roqueforti FM164]|uniref:Genomic scaffold, ProqFM164S02 n=1 Tax=Penicillium roqueforti (strain FM164) TaxID=1365484 RepID=W6Q0Q6_PENRF|nr:unnamed protein product [Penicillium roqueforti FM164]